MGTGFGKMLKQLKQMQENFTNIQDGLKDRTFEGSAGGGAVKATADGTGTLTSIKIDPDVVKSGDVEMLEDLVLAAVTQAAEKATDAHTEELQKLKGDLGVLGKLGLGG